MAIPGLGTGTGNVPVRVCANLMWTGYTLFNDYEFADFVAMRAALQEQIGAVTRWTKDTRVRILPPE